MNKKTAALRIREAQSIKGDLAVLGYSLSDIDRQYGLPAGTARDTLRSPNRRGEEAIADALGVRPSKLWSLRYDRTTGQRLSPQPRTNYDRPPTIPQRRKMAEART